MRRRPQRRNMLSFGLIAGFLLVANLTAIEAKTKKGSGTGKSVKATTKGGDLKAKLAAKDAEAALARQDLQTAISKFLFATQADPGTAFLFLQASSRLKRPPQK